MKYIDYSQLWIGCQSVSDVARAYFNNYSRTDRCVRQFRLQIANNPAMYAELVAVGYNPRNKYITPAELEIIVKYWKYPGHLAELAKQQ